jgi:D-glycero-D-manno-heptose 1,7-bisphosphate phosphatase
VPFVGDSLRDMQAAVAAGCAPHLVLTGNSEALRGSVVYEYTKVTVRK